MQWCLKILVQSWLLVSLKIVIPQRHKKSIAEIGHNLRFSESKQQKHNMANSWQLGTAWPGKGWSHNSCSKIIWQGTSQGLMALVAFSQSLGLEILEVFSNLHDSMTPWFCDLQHPKRDKNISGAQLDLQTQRGTWKALERPQQAKVKRQRGAVIGFMQSVGCSTHHVQHKRSNPSSDEHLECNYPFFAQPLVWYYTNNITDLFSVLQVRASWVSWRDFMVQKESRAFFPIF